MNAAPVVEASSPVVTGALLAALEMAFLGDEHQHGWYNGLLFALEGVSAERASRVAGRVSVAAHAEHVRFVLHVVNAWVRGENPEVDWTHSWTVSSVTDPEWTALREAIKQELETLRTAIREREVWLERGVTMLINNIAHTAYHAGAIRHLLKEPM